MFERGILVIGTHNMSYAHSDADVAQLLAAYDEILPMLRAAVDREDLHDRLRCEPLQALFKVR
jgi:glutamate-1-semialdehyde 2,1-aminomutase